MCLVKPLVVELGDDLATLLKKDFTALFFSEILDLTVLKNTYGRLIWNISMSYGKYMVFFTSKYTVKIF